VPTRGQEPGLLEVVSEIRGRLACIGFGHSTEYQLHAISREVVRNDSTIAVRELPNGSSQPRVGGNERRPQDPNGTGRAVATSLNEDRVHNSSVGVVLEEIVGEFDVRGLQAPLDLSDSHARPNGTDLVDQPVKYVVLG